MMAAARAASLLALCAAALAGCSSGGRSGQSEAVGGTGFASPEDAVVALIDASRSGDVPRVKAILGPGVEALEGNSEEKTQGDLQRLAAAFDRRHQLIEERDGSVTLQVGEKGWEFPAPLVQSSGRWRYDTVAGAAEMQQRRMDQNEARAVESCRAVVAAQREYLAMNPMGQSTGSYAARLISSPGQRDGLYWPDDLAPPRSPLGPLVSEALQSGALHEPDGTRQAYYGYYFRLLPAQGPGAPGGARSYVGLDGRMTLGFALVAWPETYGETGELAFIVSFDGRVFQRDLGPTTEKAVGEMAAFDPGQGWQGVAP